MVREKPGVHQTHNIQKQQTQDIVWLTNISPKDIHPHLVHSELKRIIDTEYPFQIHPQKNHRRGHKSSTYAYAIECEQIHSNYLKQYAYKS